MNKTIFIKELSKQTGYDEEKCTLINNIIENYFILGRKNKEKIIKDLQIKANLNEDDSENVYDISIKIITGEITQRAITITSILAVFIVCDVFISWSASFRQKERVLEMPAKTSWDCFLDTYYPDERIDRIYTNKIVTMDRCM